MSDIVERIINQNKDGEIIEKFPHTNFNSLTVLSVPENYEAVLFLNGKALDVFSYGEYSFETKNIPLVAKELSREDGDMTPFECGVCFVSKQAVLDFEWESKSGKKGTANVKVNDSSKFVSYMLMFTDLENQSVCDYLVSYVSENENADFDTLGVKADIKVTFVPETEIQVETKTEEKEPEITEIPVKSKTEISQAKPTSKKINIKLILIVSAIALIVIFAVIAVFFRPETNDANNQQPDAPQSVYEDGFNLDEEGNLVIPDSSEVGFKEIKDAQIGDFVLFGSYEQDGDAANGAEQLGWKVIDKKDGKLTLITEYCIDCLKFNETFTEIGWPDCSLRKWLNGEFYKTAFTETEKTKITVTTNRNALKTNYNLEDGNNTDDYVYLLSLTECKNYFAGSEMYRRAKATKYAESKGSYVEDTSGNCWWWLRSPGDVATSATFIESDGYAGNYGDGVTNERISVRPVINISVE